MAAKQFKGVTDKQTINADDVAIDTLPVRKRVTQWLRNPGHLVISLMVMSGAAWWYSDFGGWFMVLALGLAAWAAVQKENTPLKMPIQSRMADPNQPHPATGKPSPGQGIFFIGNDLTNGKEVWITNDDCRQHFLILGTTGAGKSMADDAFVHTAEGWKRMGDIRLGDMVSTPDGGTAPVIGVHPQGELDICRVTFEDGRTLDVSRDHLWTVHVEGDRPSKGRSRVLATDAIAHLLDDNVRLAVRLPAPVGKAQAALPSEPYIVGQGLAETQYLPGVYIEASLEQRWALMQGLMDASGHPDEMNHSLLTYPARLECVACGVAEVARSLGALSTVREGSASPGEHGYLVDIRHPDPGAFFRDPGKRAATRPWPSGMEPRTMDIARVEMNVRRAEATCIEVDHPDHLFVAENYVVTHNTESLLGFGANALSWGSGFLFCDGKGDVALFAKVYAMARRFGREDDLLVLNFMTGNKDLGASGGELLSNTLNPFSNGSSDGLTQMVVSLMDDVGGDGAMWKGRATAMLTGVMRALCWLRDRGYLDLNVSEIRDYMSLKKIIELADEARHPDLPGPIRKSIRSYLTSLPGFQEEKKEKQAQTTLDQHGYLEMQFTKILGSLADVYGHIFATPYGEVDMYDVVLNRRILVIMLPALEKAGDEIANLGKIVVATLKGMMGATLGSRLEGSWDDVVENRPTTSPSPFLCILDEVGYYTVEGMALMAAQARSLGFSMCYASQDINAMKRLNEKEAASIIANTNTKIFMKTEDPNETADLAKKRAGTRTRARVGGYDLKMGELAGRHAIQGENGSLEEADVVHLADLTGQQSGEMHVMSGDKVIRARGFYAQPEGGLDKNLLALRANHFVKVPKPTREEVERGSNAPEILERLSDPDRPAALKREADEAIAAIPALAAANDEIGMALIAFDRVLGSGRQSIEASCAAVAEIMKAQVGHVTSFSGEVRNSYAARVPPAQTGGFVLDEFDAEDDFPDTFADTRAGRRVERDPYATGVPLAPEKDPPLPPPRSQRPAFQQPRKPQRVDAAVRHGATVDDDKFVDMAGRIASNDAIMRSLAALDFDGDQVTPQLVEARLEAAVGGRPMEPAPRVPLAPKVDAFDRAAAAVQPAKPSARALLEEDDEAEGGAFVSDFLEGLLGDAED